MKENEMEINTVKQVSSCCVMNKTKTYTPTHTNAHSSLKFKCNWSEEGGKVADILLQSITSVPLNWKTMRPEKRASPAGSWNGMLGVASQHAWSKGFKARPQLPEINTKPAKNKDRDDVKPLVMWKTSHFTLYI